MAGIARVKKQKRQDNRSIVSNRSDPNNVAKFKVNAASSTDSYRKISAFNTKFPNLKFTSRPNQRGERILTSSDNKTIQTLRTTSELNLTESKRENKLIKAVVAGFPFSIPASELAKHGKIVHVECLRNKEGQEIKAMLCSFIGEQPVRIDLGVWGTFPVCTYYPEPLRCYNCQRFEHHKSTCFSETRCAVCSGRHETSVCINKHKKGEQTNPRCPNCKSNHPAWSRRCPERLNRIQAKIPERTALIPKPRKHFYTLAELQRRSLSTPPRTNSQKRAPSMTSFNQSRNTPVTLPRTIFCQTENIKHCFSSFIQVALIRANASLSNDEIQVLARDFVESLRHVSRTHQPPISSSSSSQPSSSSASSSSSFSSSHSSHTTTHLYSLILSSLHPFSFFFFYILLLHLHGPSPLRLHYHPHCLIPHQLNPLQTPQAPNLKHFHYPSHPSHHHQLYLLLHLHLPNHTHHHLHSLFPLPAPPPPYYHTTLCLTLHSFIPTILSASFHLCCFFLYT